MTKIASSLLLSLFLCGCATNHEKITQTLQSHGATLLSRDFKKMSEYLYMYKEKLDRRNPKAFSPKANYAIVHDIQNAQNALRITYNDYTLKTYDDYLRIAFDKNPSITDRNDFLILGLHKLLYETYQIEKGHRITTLSYQQDAFKKLYYYLEVIKWKIKTAKDTKGNYLFITWQNNWQIELEQRLRQGINPSWEMLTQLPSIKNGRETLLDASNMNFETLFNHIISHAKNSVRIVGDEPVDVGIEAMKSIVLFL